ncbi:MAG: MFS transporter [Rhodobacteraceae bacterium]|nr:MFS transporter [Paracoccaceae bacterium]
MNSKLLSLRSLFVSVGCIQLATAAMGTLVALQIAEAGGSSEEASWVAAAYSLGFLVGCFYIFGPLARIGHIRAFTAAAALCTICTLLLSATDSLLVLLLSRFVTGLATAGLYAIGDAWINASSDNASRGRTLSIYYIVLGLTSVLSQAFVVLFSGEIDDAYVALAALYSLATVVLALTRTTPPENVGKTTLRIKEAFRESPTAFSGSFINGFVIALLIFVVPFQASVAGIPSSIIAYVVGAFYLGRILLQLPLGRLSDRTDRRIAIMLASIASALLLFVLSLISQQDKLAVLGEAGPILQIIVFVGAALLGGFIMPLYALNVAHALDRTVPVYVSATAVTHLFIYTLGSVIGPLIGGGASAAFGDTAILWLSFALMSAISAFTGIRIRSRERVPAAEATTHVTVAATSVSMAPEVKRV